MALATTLFRVYSARAYRRMRERLADVTATLAEDLAGARVVQSFRRERGNAEGFGEISDGYRRANHRTARSRRRSSTWLSSLGRNGTAHAPHAHKARTAPVTIPGRVIQSL